MSIIRNEILGQIESQEGKYYGITRSGEQRLDLRLTSGYRVSLPYHSLVNVEFFPSDGEGDLDVIIVEIPSQFWVRIEGNGLEPIYDGLNRQTVRFVREGDSKPDDHGCTVTSIQTENLTNKSEEALA